MSVDNVAVRSLQAKVFHEALAHVRVVVVGVVGVLGLRPGVLVLNEPPLKGGHAVPAIGGRVPPAPEEPQKVHPVLPFRRARAGIVPLSGHRLGKVHEILSPQGFAVDFELHNLSIVGEGNAAMKQQVAVEHLIQPPLGVEEAHMLLELLAVLEGGGQLADHLVLLLGEVVGVLPVHCGEVGIRQWVGGSVDGDALVFIVDFIQQQPVIHAELRVTENLLPLQLEENNGNGLVHPGG